MRKVVVAINFGGYDNLYDPESVNLEWDYVYLTDREYKSDIWKMSYPPLPFSNNMLNSRWWMCNLLFLGYDCVVMIGGNQTLKANPESLLAYVKNGIATHRHPNRSCLYKEAEKILELDIDYPDIIESQIGRYRSKGFPEEFGLSATGILIFQNEPAVRDFCRLWWDEIKIGSKRNQLSFDYVRWETGLEIGYLPYHLYGGELVEFHPHNGKYQGIR